jgi:pimeloyl-ACP methyl ester carboxylesterase
MLLLPTSLCYTSRMALVHVRSADGTPIAVARDGAGPPLVLVHGALSDRTAWSPLRPHLAPHFTLYAMDRRGRGDSGDTGPYAPERELEDLEAVIAAVGEPVRLCGHSAGGFLALTLAERGRSALPLGTASREAPRLAPLVSPISSLALYEPSLFGVGGREPWPASFPDELRARLAAGDRPGAARTLLAMTMGMDEDALDRFQRGPAWPRVLSLAHTTVYDAELARISIFDAASFRPWATPTLLLVGERSPAWRRAGVEALAAALPDRRVVTLPGQEHVAHVLAPARVAEALIAFFLRR